jgi:ATP-dependent helicase/nuclease subunit B
MVSKRPRIFSISPGCPFLPTLADGLLGGRILPDFPGDSTALADATIYLPNRRAARALAALLAERSAAKAQLLPRIVPLGEAEEAEFELTGLRGAGDPADILAPPIPALERRLILTRLVQRWSSEVDRDLLRLGPGIPFMVPASPADAVSLAGDLEALMDSLVTEQIAWDELAAAVDAEYSKYFEITLRFVQIAAAHWPDILAERQASDPSRRQNALILAEAERLKRDGPTRPVIAAGSTGSVPATAELLKAIAGLPNGAVILPGLDTQLDDASWNLIGGITDDETDPVHGHPQAVLRRLVDRHLEIDRAEIRCLGTLPAIAAARNRLLSEALRPAETTDLWAVLSHEERLELGTEGCRGLALVEAADEREEALAAAIALREILEQPGSTAALVTPDRAFAQRVAAELARWSVEVEDSAGQTLAQTGSGRLARLVAEAAADGLRPVRLLAILAHPQVRLGWPRATLERAATALEIGVLRGPAPARGLEGLRKALDERRAQTSRYTPRPRRRLGDLDWDLAAECLDRLARAFSDFTPDAWSDGSVDLVGLSALHRRVIEILCEDSEQAGLPDPDGSAEALAALFDDLALSSVGGVGGRFVDYPAFFTAMCGERSVSLVPRSTHRRIKILGLLEARLLSVDRVVLGGLDEGTWPPRTETDAFLNRPMRARIGLAPPERRIGQTAHDFVQALGCADVVMTRAQKRDGSPMVPSRFLQRLKAFSGLETWAALVTAGERYRALARALDTPQPAPPLPRPSPRPDPALFPRSLSVTEIETLVRDPYSIFARHVLKLDALDPIAGAPGAAERGTIIHDVLGGFAAAYPTALPDHALEDLLARGEDAFRNIALAFPELHAEWWPRFTRLATEFVPWEKARRDGIAVVIPEVSGSLAIPLKDGTLFTLRARADRIERRRDGSFVIVDFKTGQPPGIREVFAGFSPQLTLEAAILMAGGFRGVPAAQATPELLYVHTSGGRKPIDPRPICAAKGDERTVDDVVAEHRRRLQGMIARYASGELGFVSRPFPKYARRFSEYDHLARVKEWSLAGHGGAEEGAET